MEPMTFPLVRGAKALAIIVFARLGDSHLVKGEDGGGRWGLTGVGSVAT
jgi:hypothetical protein